MMNPDREIDECECDPTPTGEETGERRTSCRYPVGEIPILLSWWEAVEEDPDFDAPARAAAATTAARDAAASSRAATSTYKTMMSRGPAFRKGFQASRDEVEVRREAAAPTPESLKLRYCQGRVLDISQTGMSLLSEAFPPPDQRAWARLDGPPATDWIEVSLRGATPQRPGIHLVRFAFLASCPYDFFKALVYGKAGT
jgi:hypothetical protein